MGEVLNACSQWSDLLEDNNVVAGFCGPEKFVMAHRESPSRRLVIELKIHSATATAAACMDACEALNRTATIDTSSVAALT